MPSFFDNDLLHEGILRYRLKEFDAARKFLERALELSDDMQTRAEASFYLARMTDDPVEKRKYLEETLAINMTHPEARRELALLQGRLKASEIVNPNAVSAFVEEPQEVKADRFTCPKCGARMVYAPDGVSLFCEHCQRSETLTSQRSVEEQDFFVAMANGRGLRKPVSTRSFKCQGCGANFLLAPSEATATCAYCGSVHVIALEQMRDLLEPDALIPMTLDQKQASHYLVDWIENNKVQPQGKVPVPRGIYLPLWTFDITGSIPWNGKVTRDRQVIPVSGEKVINYNNLGIPAARNFATLLKDAFAGFVLSAAVAYDPRFLAGWLAEVYERPMADASLEARQGAVAKVRQDIQAELGQVTDLSYSTSAIMVTSYKLLFLPAWVTQVVTREQRGRVLINGQTGAVVSELRLRRTSTLFERLRGN